MYIQDDSDYDTDIIDNTNDIDDTDQTNEEVENLECNESPEEIRQSFNKYNQQKKITKMADLIFPVYNINSGNKNTLQIFNKNISIMSKENMATQLIYKKMLLNLNRLIFNKYISKLAKYQSVFEEINSIIKNNLGKNFSKNRGFFSYDF